MLSFRDDCSCVLFSTRGYNATFSFTTGVYSGTVVIAAPSTMSLQDTFSGTRGVELLSSRTQLVIGGIVHSRVRRNERAGLGSYISVSSMGLLKIIPCSSSTVRLDRNNELSNFVKDTFSQVTRHLLNGGIPFSPGCFWFEMF